MTGAPAVLLAWDTDFFGIRIGRVVVPRLDDAGAAALRAWARAERVACVYAFVDASDVHTPAVMTRLGAHPVDVRLTLRADLSRVGPTGPADVRTAIAADIPALEAIAAAAHRDSRFYADPRFPRDRVDALYRAWIRAAVERGDHVVVIDDEGEAAGYVTAAVEADGAGRIGLVAVAERARGRGAAGAMIDAALAGLAGRGISAARVGTQARNLVAQRLYQRHGFVSDAAELVYHLWLDPP